MREVKTKKNKGSLLLKIAIFCFAAFLLMMLVSQFFQISKKQTQLNGLKEELRQQQLINDELRYDLQSEDTGTDDYAEKVARRELDYVKPGERVFYNIGGND